MKLTLKHIPSPEPESIDPEWVVLNEDGSEAGYSIQDCRSYGGGFSVNRTGGDASTGNDWVEFLESTKTRAAAVFAITRRIRREA